MTIYNNRQVNLSSIQTNHLNEMASRVDNMSYSQNDLIERTREANQTLLNELDEKNKELSTLKLMIKDKTDKLSIVSVTYDQNHSRLIQNEQNSQEKDNDIKTFKKMLQEVYII